MFINQKDALYIAIYLYKGIFEKGYHDISIQIAENAVVGFQKKGRSRFRSYVRVNNRYDKSAQGNPLSLPCEDYNELATQVKVSIENSNMLEGMELNMSKVPNPSMEVLNQINSEAMSESDQDETSHEVPVHANDDFVIEDLSEEESTDIEESDCIPIEKIEKVFNEKANPATDDDYVKKLREYLDHANVDDSLEEPSIFDEKETKIETAQVQSENPVEHSKNETTPNEFVDAIASNNIRENTATAVQKYESKSQSVLDTLRQDSYICGIIKSGFDLTSNVEYMFRYLSLVKSEKAADIYINIVCHLATEFDYDISKMSKATGIDERNLMLAMMEKQFN